MALIVLITISVLVLIAYAFDITARHTRIPAVLLLISLGWGAARGAEWLDIQIPAISELLPVLGTLGLILIVLEGSLDLELRREKLSIIRKSIFTAIFPMLLVAAVLAGILHWHYGHGFQTSLLNAIPLCIISSAIAIPSARNLRSSDKDFIVFESSMSDIVGVVLFNIILTESHFSAFTVLDFLLKLLIILAVSFVGTGLLSLLLSRIQHHVKFTPIVFSVILIYCIAKLMHLPALIFILVFGLFLGNLDEMSKLKQIKWLRPEVLDREVHKFKEIIVEGTFLVRVLFFLLFGYLIKTEELIDLHTLPYSLALVALILIVRALQLKVSRLPLMPMVFIAPRGLITVLLFLSIPSTLLLPEINRSLIIQVILITAILMMVGLIFGSGKEPEVKSELAPKPEPAKDEDVQIDLPDRESED